MKFKTSALLLGLLLNVFAIMAIEPYQDPTQPIDVRVADLISKMTLAEKITQLGSKAPAITRLGVKSYNYWVEGLHGVARQGLATSFPQPFAMSAAWDTVMIYDVAKVISDEARVKNNTEGLGLTYWCPVVNMERDPRWGRTEEGLGEDTYLAARLAVNYIKAMQGTDPTYLKTVATAKHFACNNNEYHRTSSSSNVDERSLREYYLPVFKACMTEGKAYSIMSSYNAVNGVPSPANRTLLTNILRNEWGFTGFVVSDCDAVSDASVNHKYVPTLAEATAISLRNGNDLNCGTTMPTYANEAITNGLITEADVDNALKKVFKARFLLGEFDPAASVPYTSLPSTLLDCQAHRDLALVAARKSIVLLKNQNAKLPLNKDAITTIAVVGPNANMVQLGDYSGAPNVSISPVKGIADKFGIDVSNGKIEAESFATKHASIRLETCAEGTSNIGYIRNGYTTTYTGINFGSGKDKVEFRAATSGAGGNIEVRLDGATGTLIATVPVTATGAWQTFATFTASIANITGLHDLHLTYTGGSGYLYNINWFRFYNSAEPNNISSDSGFASNAAGTKTIKYAKGCTVNGAKVQTDFDLAVNYARSADVAILVCGTDLETGGESKDISTLNLPGAQQELMEAVFAANPNTILVLVNGFALSVNWAEANIPAIISSWFNGQAQGTALADVLFGDYNPGGKLTSTWFKSVADLPAMSDYDVKNNRTYMYFQGTPLYPFGHGLSYTQFAYSNLALSGQSLSANGSITVSADITNSGSVAGDEVVQMYVHANSVLKRPIKELKGFKRITLQPGEKQTVTFVLRNEDLQYYDEATRTFKVESGNVDIYVGSSSADIRLSSTCTTSEATVASTYRQDPFAVNEAENFEAKSSTVTQKAISQSNICANLAGNNSYVAYKNFDFNASALQFNANLSSVDVGSSISVVLDNINGPVAGTLNIVPTADVSTYAVQSCTVSAITGIHDVYLVLKGSTTAACKVDWLSFQTAVTGLDEVATPDKLAGYKCSVFPNPANTNFSIKYHVPELSDVKIDIYSLQGTLVKSINQPNQTVGDHQLELGSCSEQFSQGMYIVKFSADRFNQAMLLNIIH